MASWRLFKPKAPGLELPLGTFLDHLAHELGKGVRLLERVLCPRDLVHFLHDGRLDLLEGVVLAYRRR